MQSGDKVKILEAGHAGADVKVGDVLVITKATPTEIFVKKDPENKDEMLIRFRRSRVGTGFELVVAKPAKAEKPETKPDPKG